MDNEIVNNSYGDTEKSAGTKQKIFRWLKVIVLLYAIIGIALFYLQEKLLFHPEKLSADYVYHFDVPFQEINIPFNETDTVNM
ncbi:MAG: hypothetical protein RIS73_416, partial [Bacteroidota bacterium]